jgi:hypothetical protein
MSDVLNEIKILLAMNNTSMTDLLNILNEMFEKNDSLPNLHKKLTKETIRYTEIQEIAEALGYELYWIPKNVNLGLDQRTKVYRSTRPEYWLKRQAEQVNNIFNDPSE